MLEKHRISAEAVIPSTVLVIKKQELNARTAADIAVAKQLLEITDIELRRAQNHSLMLSGSADERVANFLFEMKKRNRQKEVDLLMSRQDIADHLHLAIESVSRTFARLEELSVVSLLTHRCVAVHIRKRLGRQEIHNRSLHRGRNNRFEVYN